MSHNEFLNWIQYDEEKSKKKNINKSIDMSDYQKLTLKRLREIVKFHNKNVRNYAKHLKQEELREYIIKSSEYKTKDALIKKLSSTHQHTLYHKNYLTVSESSKEQGGYDDIVKETYSKYLNLLKSGKKEEAKQELNAGIGTIKLLQASFPKIHTIMSAMERKSEFRKQAKQDLKELKNVSVKLPKDQGKFLQDIAKLTAPLKALKKINSYVQKLSKAKPAQQQKLIAANVKLAKKGNTKSIKNLPKPQRDLLLQLAKIGNPMEVLKRLVDKVGYKAPVKKQEVELVIDKAPTKPAPTAPKVSKKKQDFSDVSDRLGDISQKYYEELNERIESDKKFGSDYKKYNKKFSEVVDGYKSQSKDEGIRANLVDMFFQDSLLDELKELTQTYIKKNNIKNVHMMPSGKIMANKEMKEKPAAPKKAAATPATSTTPETSVDKEKAVDNLLKQIKKSYEKNKPKLHKMTDTKYKNFFNKKLNELYDDVQDIYQEDLTIQKRFNLRERFSAIIPFKKEPPAPKKAAAPKKAPATSVDKFLQYPKSAKDVSDYLKLHKKIIDIKNASKTKHGYASTPEYIKTVNKKVNLQKKIFQKYKQYPERKGGFIHNEVSNYLGDLINKSKN